MFGEKRTGVVRDDPTKTAVEGDTFSVFSVHHKPIGPIGAGDLEAWDHFDTALIGIGFGIDGHSSVEGSAVLVGPGLALAARHVIEPWLYQLEAGAKGMMGFSITKAAMVMWHVKEIAFTDSDVAILRLELASDMPPGGLRVAHLTTRLPRPGEPIMIAGMVWSQGAKKDVEAPIGVCVGIGEITNVYPTGRDRVMLPGPCIEVGCLTKGGMSGGPAFDESGDLLGILTSSFEDDGGPSYVSLWWPMALIEISSCWPTGFISLPTTILGMQRAGLIFIERPEAIALISDKVIGCEPWS